MHQRAAMIIGLSLCPTTLFLVMISPAYGNHDEPLALEKHDDSGAESLRFQNTSDARHLSPFYRSRKREVDCGFRTRLIKYFYHIIFLQHLSFVSILSRCPVAMAGKPVLESDVTYIQTPNQAPSAFDAFDCGVSATKVSRSIPYHFTLCLIGQC